MARFASPRLVIVAVAMFAAGCIVEPPGPPAQTVRAEAQVLLTADVPRATTALHFEAVPGDRRIAGIDVWGSSNGPPNRFLGTQVWVSFVDTTTGGLTTPLGWAHAGLGTPIVSGECPVTGCDETWLAIARWLDPAPGDQIAGTIAGTVTARSDRPAGPSDAPFALDRLTVTEATVPGPDPVQVAAATVGGSTTVAIGRPAEVRHFIVHVAPDIASAARTYPNVGRLAFFASRVDASSDRLWIRAEVRVSGPDGTNVSGLGGLTQAATEIDLLGLCPTTARCEIPIDVTWAVAPRTNRDTIPPSGWVSAVWRLEARFDTAPGAAVPSDAIVIAEVSG
jgi:hypothetical protein